MTRAPNRRSNESGAILIFLVLGLLVFVGFAWLVISTGSRLVTRQNLQYAADAAAWGQAVLYAKGLNMVAFSNDLMATLVAVLITLKLIVQILAAVSKIAWGMCFWGNLVACGAIPVVKSVQVTFEGVHDVAYSLVDTACTGLENFQNVVVGGMPAVAFIEGQTAGAANDTDASVWPVPPLPANWSECVGELSDLATLPVEDDDPSVLCERAIDKVQSMIESITPSPLDSLISGLVGEMLEAFNGYYCHGFGSGSFTPNYEQTLPELSDAEMAECVDGEVCTNAAKACDACNLRQATHGDIKKWFYKTTTTRWDEVSEDGGDEVSTDRIPEEGTDEVRGNAIFRSRDCEYDDSSMEVVNTTRIEPGFGGRSIDREVSVRTERHSETEWILIGCSYQNDDPVDAGEPPPEHHPKRLIPLWRKCGRNQLRGVALETGDDTAPRRAVGMAVTNEGDRPGTRASAVAQAEYWSTLEEGEEESDRMWKIRWRAYMRRFYVPGAALPVEVPGLENIRDLFAH